MSEMVSEGWKELQLSEIGNLSTSAVNKESRDDEKYVSLLNYMDVYNHDLLTDSYRFQKVTAPDNQIINSSVKQGDVFFTPSSETPDDIGHSVVFLGKAKNIVHSYHTVRLRLSSNKILNDNFKAYAFKSESTYKYFRKIAQGSTRFTLSLSGFNKLKIFVPPLPEQKKIASILTSVDEVIENTQKQIDKLQDLKKGTMNELLTKGIGHTEFKDSELGRIPKSWECVKLGHIAKVTDGAHKTPKYIDSGVPFLRVTDIQSTEINITKTKYISREEHQELCKRCLPEKGDVLLSKNGTIGITKIINWDWEFSIFVSLALLKIHNKDNVNVEFLDLYLQSPIVRKQIKDRAKQGSVTNLHLEEIRDFDFVIPSTEEQNTIVCIVSSIETNIRTKVHKLHETQSLKKSLMQDLLTGKVRVSVN